MKRTHLYAKLLSGLVALSCGNAVFASEAQTSATAGGGLGRAGTAAATARYEGDRGFARTDTKTGKVNLARGVAVGVDEDGLTLSISTAIAPKNGPALATNFNLSIGRDGDVGGSVGHAVALGGLQREVSAGGGAQTNGHNPVAVSQAGGRTVLGGIVRANSRSYTEPRPIVVRRVIRR